MVTAVFAAVDDLDEVSAQDRADLAMHEVAELSLAGEDTGDEQGSQVVHTLISRTLRFHGTLPTRREQLSKAAVKALNRTLPEVSDIRTHRTLEHWVTHGRELAVDPQDVETAELLGRVARYDYERGNYRAAEQAKRKQYQIYRVLQGEEHPGTLTSMSNLAVTLQTQGDLVRARALHEQVLAIRRQVLGENHPDTSISAWMLLATLVQLRDFAAAQDILEKDLRWLLDRGPAELGDTQRQIREMLIKSLRNSGAERRAGFLALIRNRIRDLFRH